MINKIKSFVEGNRPKIILCLCFVSVYLAGVWSGKNFQTGLGPQIHLQSIQTDYTTKKSSEQTDTPKIVEQKKLTNNNDQSKTEGDCYIKGNIGSGQKKTYHIPGGSFYDRTIPEMCFNSEHEAENAGFTKSSR